MRELEHRQHAVKDQARHRYNQTQKTLLMVTLYGI
jgi:hypothetical protein